MDPWKADSTQLPDRVVEWRVSRSGGAGGQNVNKVSSRVELRIELSEWVELPGFARDRIRRIAARRVTDEGVLRFVVDTHRDQGRNRAEAIHRLEELVTEALRPPPPPRRPTKPTRGSQERRMAGKRRRAVTKLGRSGSSDD